MIQRHTDREVRQSICEVFLERNRSAFSLPSPPQGSPKPCRQDADPHTETWSTAILEPEGGWGRALPLWSPLYFCSRVKGVLWGNIPVALPQPASTSNSQEKHSSSPALAFTRISRGAFLKPCPSPRRAPWGRIPSALSPSLPHLPSALSLPFSDSRLPLQSSISAINSTDRIRDTRQSIPMCSLSALQWSWLKCMERCYTSSRQRGDNGCHWSQWHVTSFSFSLSIGCGRRAAPTRLDFIKAVLAHSWWNLAPEIHEKETH